MRKLKIVYIATARAHYIYPYLEYFKERGHAVYLVSYDRYATQSEIGVPVYDVSFGAQATARWSKWRYGLSGIRTAKILKDLRPDIVHGHYARSAGLICYLSGYRPYIVSVRGSDLLKSTRSILWAGMIKRILRASVMVHAVSDQLAAVTAQCGVESGRIFTSTQGVNTRMFDFSPRIQSGPSGTVSILCTRKLAAQYDPWVIVEACRRLNTRGVSFSLTFAASGPQKADLLAWVTRHDLLERVRFMNGYTNADLPALLASHDIYVSASKWDGTSISLLEAMAAGIFPIVSRIESNQAWVSDGKTALMFDAGNAAQLEEAIGQAIGNQGLREQAVMQNRRIVEVKADRETNLKHLEDKYYAIAGLNP